MGVLGAFGSPRGAAGWFLAVPVQPPRGHLVNDHRWLPTELDQPGCGRVHKRAQGASEMPPLVALEAAPLVLLGIEMGTVTGQGQDLQPLRSLRQRPPRRRAGV